MLIAVDAATIQPGHSAGVEAFTYGLLRGFTTLARHDLRVSVLHGTGEQWRHRVPDPAVHWVEIDVALGSGSRLARLGRRHAPRWLLSSRAVRRTVNAVRDRARPDTGTADVTLHPFHGAPVRTGRSVLVLHDLRAFQPRFRSAGYAAVVRDNVARADAVVVSWPHPYRQVLDLFPGAAGKTVLIPPPTFHPPSAHATRPEPGLLVYPASTAPHKNHATLLEALAMLPGYRLVCPGPLVQPGADRLLARADRPDLRGRVSFPGFVSVSELAALYGRAWATVVPSLWEAASGAMFESFSWGLPVACADVEPLRAQLDFAGGEASLFAPTDPASLAAAVRRLETGYAHYAAAAVRASRRLAGRTWSDTARDYAGVLEWVAGGRAGPVPRSPFAQSLSPKEN